MRFARQERKGARQQKSRNRRPPPGQKPVRRIPRQRARSLPRENRILEVVIDDSVGPGVRSSVSAHPFELPPKRATDAQLDGVIAIVPPVAQAIYAVVRNRREGCEGVWSEGETAVSELRNV